MPPKLEDSNRVLIVEGYSDLTFYAELLETLNKTTVFIKKFNGKADLTTQLEVFINPQLIAEKEAIGVIVDADDNPDGTFPGGHFGAPPLLTSDAHLLNIQLL